MLYIGYLHFCFCTIGPLHAQYTALVDAGKLMRLHFHFLFQLLLAIGRLLNFTVHFEQALAIGQLIPDKIIEDFYGAPMRVIIDQFLIFVQTPLRSAHFERVLTKLLCTELLKIT